MRLIDADALRAEWLGAVGEYTANEVLGSIDDISTAPHEMSADVYLWQRERMCHSFHSEYFDPCIDTCEECPLVEYCPKRGCLESAEAVDIVKKWMQEHPEERSEDEGDSF